jgi:hypothetical protein
MPTVGIVKSFVLFLPLVQTFAPSECSVRRQPSREVSVSSFVVCRASSSRLICNFDTSDFALPTGEWPYTESDMARIDNSDDVNFYRMPRFVTHIDDRAIESLTDFYRQEFTALLMEQQTKRKLDVLDLCSSWISHLPEDIAPLTLGRVEGIGMSEKELAANKQLTNYHVQDLNKEPVRAFFISFAVCRVIKKCMPFRS